MLNQIHIFILNLVYKVGIREGFLLENPEFKIEGLLLIFLLIIGYFVLNNYKI